MLTAKRLAQQVLRHSKTIVKDRTWTSPHVAAITRALQPPNPPPFDTALFNFTIDFELIWGNGNLGGHGHTVEKRLQAARIQQENFAPFVRMLEELQFPISWAIVGKLIAPEWPLPPEETFQPAWFDADWYALPDTTDLKEEYWRGEPFLDVLKNSPVGHEILSHGYAHIDYADPAATGEIAVADMRLSKRLLEEVGFSVDGFVFPCNRVGHTDLLPLTGYRIARGGGPEWHLTDTPVPMTPVGFCINPGFMSFHDIKQVIDTGIRYKAFIHPWMHLVECSLKQRDIDNFYRPMFTYVREKQEQGWLRAVSFRELADRLQANASK